VYIGLIGGSKDVYAAGPTSVRGEIKTPTVWTQANSPYVIEGYGAYITSTLTIEPGVVVKFQSADTYLSIYPTGSLTAQGTLEAPIVFTSYKDDAHGGDTNSDGGATLPDRGQWYAIINNGQATFEHVEILYGASSPMTAGVLTRSNTFSLKNSVIRDNLYACVALENVTTVAIENNVISNCSIGVHMQKFKYGTVAKVTHNNIVGNATGARVDSLIWWQPQWPLDARENWWGDASGPYYNPTKFTLPAHLNGKGNPVGDGILFDPWLGQDLFAPKPVCTENCFSNVLFLPGLKASGLYKNGASGTEDTLWPPNPFGNDIAELGLDSNGTSYKTVYTRDAIDSVYGTEIYGDFLTQLSDLKTSGTIQDFEAFAYDWRQNVEDIVRDGTRYKDNVTKYPVAELAALADTSKSGKVTIIAHSNGGLLAKALMLELEKQGKTELVDKIILVGTPQMGTPLTTLSLLYGYDETLPAGLMSQSEARVLGEHMPGAYGLLPSASYLGRLEAPFIQFLSAEHTRYKKFQEVYGDSIDSFDEFKSFLLGTGDGRTDPDASAVDEENILESGLLDKAIATHERLDAWVPPASVQVIEIAGWGLDTVSGVKYDEKSLDECHDLGGAIPLCTETGMYEPVYDPQFTVDGDAVVAAPSALMFPEAVNVKKYWVDLYKYNESNIYRRHRDILSTVPVQSFIGDTITRKESPLPEYFSLTRPEDYRDAKPRIRMSLYSPLDIHLYDDAGRHTGPKTIMIDGQSKTIFEENIPNSYYYQLGDRKYVGFDSGEHIHVVLDGYALGDYTLKLESTKITETGEEAVYHTRFAHLPTTSDTQVIFDIPASGLEGMSSLSADVNGDGANDYSISPVPNGTAVLDMLPPATTPSVSGTGGKNDWYTSDVAVSLSATDNPFGTGVAVTRYAINDGEWRDYQGSILLTTEGESTIRFFSEDKQGNKEEEQSFVVRIDKTAPEIKIVFNDQTEEIAFSGQDSLSATTVSVNQDSVIVTDVSGHTTELQLDVTKNKKQRIDLSPGAVSYDGTIFGLDASRMQYQWQRISSGEYTNFSASLKTANESVDTKYVYGQNKTLLTGKDREEKWLSGRMIPGILTEKGVLKIVY
jgi:pimeloyl-ACP methyl ester carboxylesterase